MHGSVKRTYFREKSWCILQIIVVDILEATDKPNTSK